eukprot:622324-Pyramimonas_sp.AAC.1
MGLRLRVSTRDLFTNVYFSQSVFAHLSHFIGVSAASDRAAAVCPAVSAASDIACLQGLARACGISAGQRLRGSLLRLR